MDSVLAGFVRALRAAGAQASPAEAIDAARTVALLGYGERDTLKAALATVLAKSETDRQIHDGVFDLYFGAPDEAARPPAGTQAGAAATRTGDAAVDTLLRLASQADDPNGDARRVALLRAMSKVAADDIRFATQTHHYARRTLEALGIEALEARLLHRIADPDPQAQAEAAVLAEARDTLLRHARALVQHRFALFGKPATERFMTDVAVHRPIGRMAAAEMERMRSAVQSMARKLAARHSRRQRVQLRGQLDFRRTLRANAGHDGVPFSLTWKQRRRDKPRIVAVCDVSGSVAANVRFLLMFLYALGDVMDGLRCFAFSNRLHEISGLLERLPFDDAMARIMVGLGSGSTDYGQAWADFHEQHWDALDRTTTVLVLGDGRSNGTDPRLGLFAELASRVRRVMWLSPEPPARWGTGDSVLLRLRPHCSSMSHCASAVDLERVLDAALDSHGDVPDRTARGHPRAHTA